MCSRSLRIAVAIIAFLACVSGAEGKRRVKGASAPIWHHTAPALTAKTLAAPCIATKPAKYISRHDTISITFIGDVMQHGKQLADALVPGEDPMLPQSYNYDYTFRFIEEKLKGADLAVANMEFPLGIPPYSGYPLFSAPESILWKAQESGIDLFLLANNHLLDKGKKGFLKTLETYRNAGARYIGAYSSKEEEEKLNPVFYNIKGIRFAVLNFTYGTNGFPVPEPCRMNMMDTVHIKECIARAKDWGADIIICTPHWGEEYMLKPSLQQKRMAKFLLREGVKVIIGGHPHVPQAAEYSKERILFYSLGNYISNQTTPDYTQLELMVTIKIRKDSYTGEVELLEPQIEYLWCFKRDEFAPHYTVVPVKEIIGKEEMVKERYQYRRMVNTYNDFIGRDLIVKD